MELNDDLAKALSRKERLDHLQAKTKSVVLRSDTRDILRKDRDSGPSSGKGNS